MKNLLHFGIVLYYLYLVKTISASSKAPVDVVSVNDPTLDSGRLQRLNGMPNNIKFDLQAVRNALPTKFNLIKNENLGEQKQIYVVRNDTDGKPILMRENIPFDLSVGEYQDSSKGAAFTVTCTEMEKGKCIPILEGSFISNGTEYELEPIPEDPAARVKRSTAKQVEILNVGKTLYAIYERDPPKPCKADYKIKEYGRKYKTKQSSKADGPNDLVTEPIALPFRKNIKIVDANGPGFNNQRLVTAAQTLKTRQAGNHYVVELLLVIDHSIYQRWFDKSAKATVAEKDVEAKAKIRQYFAHVVNGIDLRYASINEPDFSIGVAVSGYIIADNPSTAVWANERIGSTPRDLLSIQNALRILIDWRRSVPLPEHDHIMLFTGHDLYSERSWDPRDTSVAGYATVAAMCRRDSASVCEDHGGFSSINTATHELGHSIGALHDGDGNSCSGNDQYIMTASGGRTDTRTELNPWKFSTCSIQSFRRFINAMRWRNCLKDEAIMYDEEEFNNHIAQKPGQLYGPNKQCSQHLGTDSFYGWGRSLGSFKDVCTRMACKKPDTRTSYSILMAARGTSCGNKMWCIDGVCTHSKDAPARDGNLFFHGGGYGDGIDNKDRKCSYTCVHGDTKRKFDGKTCKDIVAEFSGNCYEPFYSELCCESCKNLTQQKQKAGVCKFGDKSQWCYRVQTKPYLCYPNEDLCCGTCQQFATGVPGCEYGDHQRNCDRRFCHTPGNEAYTQSCCATCGLAPKQKRPITTAKPTTTRRTFTRPKTKPPTQPTKPIVLPTEPPLIKDPIATDGWCLKPDAMYFIISCSRLQSMIQNLCSISAFQSRCCEPCSQNPPQDVPVVPETCVDSPGCNQGDIKGATCYDQATRDKCCATCKGFETGDPDCMYGDRNRRCAMYVNFSPRICRRNSDICCDSCKNVAAADTPTRRIIITRQSDPPNGGGPRQPQAVIRRGPVHVWLG